MYYEIDYTVSIARAPPHYPPGVRQALSPPAPTRSAHAPGEVLSSPPGTPNLISRRRISPKDDHHAGLTGSPHGAKNGRSGSWEDSPKRAHPTLPHGYWPEPQFMTMGRKSHLVLWKASGAGKPDYLASGSQGYKWGSAWGSHWSMVRVSEDL